MKVTQVALDDIKSYEGRTEVPLTGGVTAILGENGAGKSTVQEAIGFALFDSLPFNTKDFVREGCSSGSVEVTFELGVESGHEIYRVERYAGRSAYNVARKEGDEWVEEDIDSKDALIEWLCARFGLADGDELSDLWESCIGVPQTRFLADFAQTASGRKATFDALLDIDAYEESYKGTLKDAPDAIETEQAGVREEISELTGEVQALPERRRKVEDLEAEIASLAESIDETEAKLDRTQERHDELAAVEERIDGLEDDLQAAKNEVETTTDALETARKELGRAQAAKRTCEAAADGHERYLAAEEREETLEEREAVRDELRERKRKRETEIQRLEENAEELEDDLEKHEAASATVADLADVKDRYDEVDECIRERERMQTTIDTLEDDLDETASEIDATVGDLVENHGKIKRIEDERASAPDIEELESALDDRKAERAALAGERDRLHEQLERLRDADADAHCPTCDQPLSADHRRETIAERQTRLDEIADERAGLEERIEAVDDRLETAKAVTQRANSLPVRYDQRDDLAERLERLKTEREEITERIQTLEADVADLSDLRETRDELAAARDTYVEAKTRAEDTADAESDLDAVQDRLESERDALTDIEDELADYEGLDEQLADVRETVSETKADHETYIQHRQQAAEVEDRRERVEELEASLDEAEETREKYEETLKTTREEFDAEEYSTLDERITELTGELGGYRKQKDARETDHEKATAAVEQLETKLDERTEKVEYLKELAADHRFATWVRENVRAAGPKMREVITDRIGERANQLFRTIRGRAAESLEWTSDYEIVVSDGGVRKSFDTLSGGEKMAAALSVRLAILEQLSGIGVAFLDEPTANLDTEKKKNLVEQLDKLDAFDQLAVISHDTAFETMTDYAVTVTKNRQTTEVNAD